MKSTPSQQTRPVEASGTFMIGDLRVHRLGYGAMQITGKGVWGPPRDHDEAISVLRRAVELGVDLIDTANSYGPYVSEELICEALHPYPRGLVIATKAGLVRTGPDQWHAVGRAEYLRQECEMSLRRLKVERIDLFQLHRIDPKVPAQEQFGLLKDLQKEGKIRHVGLSQVNVDEIKAARRVVPIVTVQNRYNLIDRQSEAVLDYCGAEKIGFIPWFPIASGKLAQPGGIVDRLAREIHATSAQIALAWLLHHSPVMLPIPGTSTVAHLEENCNAATIKLTDAQYADLSAAKVQPDIMPQITVQQALQLGIERHRAGQLENAEKFYRGVLAVQPGNADALRLLGTLASQRGQFDLAADFIARAIAVNPGNAEFHGNLGDVLVLQDKLDAAIAAYSTSLRLRPDSPEVCNNLGNVLLRQGKIDQAIAAYRDAIRIRPGLAESHMNLGNCFREKGEITAAIAAYTQAIALKPSLPGAHNNLGNALRDQGKLDDARAAYSYAIEIKPDHAEAHSNLGAVLQEQGRVEEALDCFDRAMAIRPDEPRFGSNRVYALHLLSRCDAAALFVEHRRWNERYAAPLKGLIQPHTNDPSPGRRLKVGYVSPDLTLHPVGRFLRPLLENHDHRSFEIVCYSDVLTPDPLTGRFRGLCDQWRNIVGLSDEQTARLIRQDGIDLLIDLTMHMERNRLLVFARKPAPVQVTYLAYSSTTGMDAIDYRLTDPYIDPPGGNDDVYSEESIRLPDTFWCHQPSLATPDVGPLPALANGYVTFGCLNNFAKISAEAMHTFFRVLAAVPSSRLVLHAKEGSHRQQTWDGMKEQGLDPERLRFVGRAGAFDYFGLYQQLDISLDPFPCAGGTTTFDSVWMGVPVITLAGKTAIGRAGVSILSNLGLPEWIGNSPEHYVRIATEMASDLSRLTSLRAVLRERLRTSILSDTVGFTRNVESALREMWKRWCARGSG